MTLSEVRRSFFRAARQSPEAIRELRKAVDFACPHCKEASVHFNFASEQPDGTIKKIAGSNVKGNRSHLRTNPDSQHTKGCIATVFADDPTEYDDTKGYRFHLNLGEIPERNPRNGQLVRRNAEGRIIILDEDLRDREPWQISEPDDIVPLLKSGQFSRINHSVVVYGSQKVPWNQFFIHRTSKQDPEKRFRELAQSLTGTIRFGEKASHPVLVDLNFVNCTRTKLSDENGNTGDTLAFKFPRVRDVYLAGRKAPVSIIPELHVTNHHLFDRMVKIQKDHGEIFVLAKSPVLQASQFDDCYTLKIKLEDPKLYAPTNMQNIMDTARTRESERTANTDIPSGRAPT